METEDITVCDTLPLLLLCSVRQTRMAFVGLCRAGLQPCAACIPLARTQQVDTVYRMYRVIVHSAGICRLRMLLLSGVVGEGVSRLRRGGAVVGTHKRLDARRNRIPHPAKHRQPLLLAPRHRARIRESPMLLPPRLWKDRTRLRRIVADRHHQIDRLPRELPYPLRPVPRRLTMVDNDEHMARQIVKNSAPTDISGRQRTVVQKTLNQLTLVSSH